MPDATASQPVTVSTGRRSPKGTSWCATFGCVRLSDRSLSTMTCSHDLQATVSNRVTANQVTRGTR